MTNYRTLTLAIFTALSVTVTGCSAVKGVSNKIKKKDEVVMRAEKSENGYYEDAQAAIEKGRYNEAEIDLTNLRTFYPSSVFAQQALLDLIYVNYQAGDMEKVTATTAQFMNAYPTSRHLDYALYAQGVTNMGGSPKAPRIFKINQSERDTSYLRLAFDDFRNLISRFPNSIYAPDAAQRMTAIYNDFAEHEMTAARWYIKRDAYVAAANRAKWVFQYYPQSTAVPEAIAILAYSNEKLGLTDTANQYKTLLQINYPQYLTAKNQVILPSADKLGVGKRAGNAFSKGLNVVSFGKLGKSSQKISTNQTENSHYDGQVRQQIIRQANTLQLPPTEQ